MFSWEEMLRNQYHNTDENLIKIHKNINADKLLIIL